MKKKSELGLEDKIDDVNIEELVGNKVALKMLLHNHQKLEDENTMLKQDLQRQATFERSLEKREDSSKTAGIFSLFSSIILGFGINFVTSDSKDIKGWIFVFAGVILEILSLYFTFRKVD